MQNFLKSKKLLFKNAHGLRKANLLRTSAVGGAAKPLFLCVGNCIEFSSRDEMSTILCSRHGCRHSLLFCEKRFVPCIREERTYLWKIRRGFQKEFWHNSRQVYYPTKDRVCKESPFFRNVDSLESI